MDTESRLCNKRTRQLFFIPLILLVMILCCPVPAMAANMIKKAEQNSISLAKGKLVTTSKGTRYRYSKTKTYAQNIWLKIGNDYYYFDKTGYAKTGWFDYRGKTYYAPRSGRIYHDRWKIRDGKRYYLTDSAAAAKNCFMTIKGKIYRFTTKGVLVTYLMYQIKDKWYFSKKDGSLLTDSWLRTSSGKRYFFDGNGERLRKQWVFYKGKFYYMGKTGAMVVNKKVGKYQVGEDGARIITNPDFVFLGDSRVVGMSYAISDNRTTFIGKVGEGYNWMMSAAVPRLEKLLRSNPTMYVVFCFGINDMGNVHRYVSSYSNLVSKYKYANFFFISVNPINYSISSAHGYRVTNSQIESFNSVLSGAMGFRYINTYSWMKRKGFGTNDGIHYTSSTYQNLYYYVLKKLGFDH